MASHLADCRGIFAAVCLAISGLACNASHGAAPTAGAAALQQEGLSREDLILQTMGLTREDLASDALIELVAAELFPDPTSHILSEDERRRVRGFRSIVGHRRLPASPVDHSSIVAFCSAFVAMSDDQFDYVSHAVLRAADAMQIEYGRRVRAAYAISLRHDTAQAGFGEIPRDFPPRQDAYASAIEATASAIGGLRAALLNTAEILTAEQVEGLLLAAEAARQYLVLESISTRVPGASLDPIAAYASICADAPNGTSALFTDAMQPLVRQALEIRGPLIDRLLSVTSRRQAVSIPVLDAIRAGEHVSQMAIDRRRQALGRMARIELELATNAIDTLRRFRDNAPSEHRGAIQSVLDLQLDELVSIAPPAIEVVLETLRDAHGLQLEDGEAESIRSFALVAEARRDELLREYLEFFADFRSTMSIKPDERLVAAKRLSSLAAQWNRSALLSLEQLLAVACTAPESSACVYLAGLVASTTDQASRLEYMESESIATWIRFLSR